MTMFVQILLAPSFKPVWAGDIDLPEDDSRLQVIFEMFNVDHPPDYLARSLSIGDKVAITNPRFHDALTNTYGCLPGGWFQL